MTMLRALPLIPALAALTLPAFAEPEASVAPGSPKVWLEARIKEAHALANREVEPDTPGEKKWQADAQAFIDGLIDWPQMTRKSLGRRWRELEPSQKKQFSSLLRRLIETSYKSRLRSAVRSDADRPEAIEIDWEEEKVRGERATLEATVRAGKESALIGCKLRVVDGQWRVWDLSIDSVSTVRTYSSSFRRIIAKEGWEGLITRLEKKIEDIEAGRADFARAQDLD